MDFSWRKAMGKNMEQNAERYTQQGAEAGPGAEQRMNGSQSSENGRGPAEDLQPNVKRVSDSLTEQAYMIRARHTNSAGRLFGGNLMAWIDEIGGMAARRHAGSPVTTAAVDSLQFTKPVLPGQTAVLVARVTHVGRTSMEVRVDTYVEYLDGRREQVNRAYLVFVAVKGDKPCPVPGLLLETEEERLEWEAGVRRDELRKQRRKEGF